MCSLLRTFYENFLTFQLKKHCERKFDRNLNFSHLFSKYFLFFFRYRESAKNIQNDIEFFKSMFYVQSKLKKINRNSNQFQIQFVYIDNVKFCFDRYCRICFMIDIYHC